MDAFTAIAHITGAILVLSALATAEALLMGKWDAQRSKRELESFMLSQGVAAEDLRAERCSAQIIQLLSARYSSELFRNRLSDLFGAFRLAWEWLRLIAVASALISVVWYTYSDALEVAIYGWAIVALWLFFWMTHLLFSLFCKVLTGRYPGEARDGRKIVEDYLAQGGAT